tara:strand:- start:6100 stop:6726 length:627 start_codon:yes stop_codon:yes gene_type:complete
MAEGRLNLREAQKTAGKRVKDQKEQDMREREQEERSALVGRMRDAADQRRIDASEPGDFIRDRAAKAKESGSDIVVVDPTDPDGKWKYRKSPDGMIEIVGAPDSNKGAIGLKLQAGDKFYDAINSVFDEMPQKDSDQPVGASETAPVAAKMSDEERASRAGGLSDAERFGRSEDYVPGGKAGPLIVDGVDIAATANRAAKRANLRDRE